MNPLYISLTIFSICLIFFIIEKINRSLVAILGASFLIIFGVLTQTEALNYVDYNTLGLLTGMMIIVAVTRRTGIFEYVGIQAIKLSNAKPWKIIFFLSLATAILSAFLDNVTTVLLFVPITLAITDTMKLNPIPFLISEILSSNIGGTATIIGDPPNIMIGSASHLSFIDFIYNNTPIVIFIFFINILLLIIIYRKDIFNVNVDINIIKSLDASKSITDYKLLKKASIIFIFTIITFIFHGTIDLELATISIVFAMIMLITCKIDPEQILMEVDWITLFFLAGLFTLVGGLDKTGAISSLSEKILTLSKGSLTLTSTFVIWFSGILGSIIGSVPFTAIMNPVIKHIGKSFPDAVPLWWSLSLGVCLGGNGTLLGAPCNLIVANLAKKNSYKISFFKYFVVGFPLTLISLILCNIYIFFRYFLF